MTTPALSLAAIPLILAALHGAGVAVALLRRSDGPVAARRCLAALALVLAVLLTNMALRFSGVTWVPPVVGAFVSALWLAVGPLFYGYVRALLPGGDSWEAEDAIHALPFAAQVVLTAAFLTAPALAPALEGGGRFALSVSFVTIYGVQSLVYAIATSRMVRAYAWRYRREAAGEASDRLVGLQRLTGLFGVYALALALNVGVYYATGAFISWLDYLVPLALAAMVGIVGMGLLRRPGDVLPVLALPESERQPERTRTVAALSPEMERHAAVLREVLETEQPYLDPEVRLAGLAVRIGISERTLSEVLSGALGGSFYDVINGYRVEEAKARLADPAHVHLTVLAVGLDSGFSSKASFNRVFKQRTGETPSAFRARARELPSVPVPSGDGAVREAQLVRE